MAPSFWGNTKQDILIMYAGKQGEGVLEKIGEMSPKLCIFFLDVNRL